MEVEVQVPGYPGYTLKRGRTDDDWVVVGPRKRVLQTDPRGGVMIRVEGRVVRRSVSSLVDLALPARTPEPASVTHRGVLARLPPERRRELRERHLGCVREMGGEQEVCAADYTSLLIV